MSTPTFIIVVVHLKVKLDFPFEPRPFIAMVIPNFYVCKHSREMHMRNDYNVVYYKVVVEVEEIDRDL